MSLRDYFPGQAIARSIANDAVHAYSIADAMLAAREQ